MSPWDPITYQGGSGADVRIHKSELPPDYTGAVTEEGMDGSSTCTQQYRTHDNITEEGTRVPVWIDWVDVHDNVTED